MAQLLLLGARDHAARRNGGQHLQRLQQCRAIHDSYSRDHVWTVADGIEIAASASPSVVPLPYSSADRLDPEAAFVGSIASCHMLWFLSLAEAQGFTVESYVDHATGTLAKNTAGRMAITRIALSPVARFTQAQPSPDELADLHQQAHHRCFLAASVVCEITVSPGMEHDDV